MRLSLGLFLGLALSGVFVACSSDDTSGPVTAPDASDDAGSTNPDAGADADADVPNPDAIVATPGEWTYVPFSDATCANGTPTGIGVNPGTSKRLVVYLEGGGACWDPTTCNDLKTAANLDGWDEAMFRARIASGAKSHLDRTAANNPFRDASYVYIPYCTGDVHGGDKEQTYAGRTIKHFGRRNIAAFLKRIAPTFADADRVVLTGSSAGGFGAALNYWRFKEAFGAVRVDLVDDSGPPFPNDKMGHFAEWVAAWDLLPAIAPGCAECANGNVLGLFGYYSKTYPEARFALLSYDRDGTISRFFDLAGTEFATTLAEVTTKYIDPLPNMRAFELAGTSHTMLGDLGTKGGLVELGAWLGDMESDAASWTTVKPNEK